MIVRSQLQVGNEYIEVGDETEKVWECTDIINDQTIVLNHDGDVWSMPLDNAL